MASGGCAAAHGVAARRMFVVGLRLEHEDAVSDGLGVVVGDAIYVYGEMRVVVGEWCVWGERERSLGE